MKRTATLGAAVLAAITLAVPALHADVKTTRKTAVSLEGVLGGVARVFGGRAARDGITASEALRGNRKATLNDTTGRIVDLSEEKVYTLDVKKKEYTVATFAQIRAEFEKAKADAQKQMQDMKPEDKAQLEQAGQQLEIELDVKETGQKKMVAGYDAREVVMTVTGHVKGQSLEEGGGTVLTNTMWLGPKVPALDELMEFELKTMKAIYGESFAADMQQMAGMIAMYPSFRGMAEKMATEGKKLQGTMLSSVTTFETVKSAAQMKAAADNQPSAGGGATGLLARRLLRNRNQPEARTKVLTTTDDLLSIGMSVSDADVAIPAGFKEKK